MMDQGYKHFSHSHNLIMHHMPEAIQVSCSGCHSSATGTVYVCWQCNFFLHDQCYRATRSLKHPSHPPHPLTLVPYPTYASNSFYCNSCRIIGTGFSYSCADCEFDLHVQCAYSISVDTSFNNVHPFQELAWNGVCNSGHESLPIPFTGAQNPYIPASVSVPIPHHSQNSTTGIQHPSIDYNLASVSIPANLLSNARYSSTDQTGPSVSVASSYIPNTIPSGQDPSIPQDGLSVSIPMSSQNPIPVAQDHIAPQNRPSVFIPMSSQNPIPAAQDNPATQNRPSVSIPTSSQNPIPALQDHSAPQNRPSASIPFNSQNPISAAQDHSVPQNRPSVSIPMSSQNQIPAAQDNPAPENRPSVSIPTISHNSGFQYPSMTQTKPSVSTHTNPSNVNTSSLDPPMPKNGLKDEELMHFSHHHNLSRVDSQDEDEVICSGCEETVIGNGYSCVEPECNIHLHESCFHLEKEIHHKSHPEHPLTLLPLAPYNNKNGEFTCNACFSDGTGFTYHCSICKFDLHIQCVSLPETVKLDDHNHALKLFYSCPVKEEDYTFSCDVCHGAVPKERWVYYCELCDYGTHLGCVDCEECENDSILDTQAQLQRLQLQMEMARQQAQFVASMGSSLASLAS